MKTTAPTAESIQALLKQAADDSRTLAAKIAADAEELAERAAKLAPLTTFPAGVTSSLIAIAAIKDSAVAIATGLEKSESRTVIAQKHAA